MNYLIACLVWLSAATLAHADAPSARASFERGVEALRSGSCERAIPLFQQSIEAEDKLSSWHNLGIALEECGRVVESVTVLEELVARVEEGAYNNSSDARRAQIADQLTHSRSQLGILRIQLPAGTPGSWRVEVDGTDRGQLLEGRPLRQAVDPGQHHIKATASSGQAREFAVDQSVGRGEVIRVILEPVVQQGGRLVVEAEGTIRVEGVGEAENRFDQVVDAGDYEIRAQGQTRSASVEAEGQTVIRFEARRSKTWVVWVVVGVVLAGGATALALGLRDGEEDFAFRVQGLSF